MTNATKTKTNARPKLAKGNFYEMKNKSLVRCTSARLVKTDQALAGDLFHGELLEYDAAKDDFVVTDSHTYWVEQIDRRLYAKDIAEALEAERREAEALADASDAEAIPLLDDNCKVITPASVKIPVKPMRKPAGTSPAKPAKEKKMSGLDAAATVLAKAKAPLNAKEIVERIFAADLWTTSGATPHATIYAAMIREISAKGKDSRFRKASVGHFESNK